jgi:ADP-ribose pyrophosphatase YjhB (NUDIX family)
MIDKLAWLYIKNGQLLLARSKGKDTFYVPGGKRESGESDHQALTREIKEELSVELLPNTIKFAGTFEAQADGKQVGEIVRMTCYFAEFDGEINANEEIEEVKWIHYQDKVKYSQVTKIIIEWLSSQGLLG